MLLTIMTVIVGVVAVGFLTYWFLTRDNDIGGFGFLFSIVLTLVLLITCIGIDTDANNSAKYLRQEYADICIMYDTINESNDEALRYHFYNRINEYNEAYDKYINQLDDIWIKNLIDDDLGDIEKIQFELKGD